jgi:hypothetical protein
LQMLCELSPISNTSTTIVWNFYLNSQFKGQVK